MARFIWWRREYGGEGDDDDNSENNSISSMDYLIPHGQVSTAAVSSSSGSGIEHGESLIERLPQDILLRFVICYIYMVTCNESPPSLSNFFFK